VKRPTKVGRLTVTWELASTDLQVNDPHNAPINSNQSVVCSLLQNVVYVSQWNDPYRHMRQNYAYIMAYAVYEVFIVGPKTAYSGLQKNIINKTVVYFHMTSV